MPIAPATRPRALNAAVEETRRFQSSAGSRIEPVSIAGVNVNVEPYFDLDAIGILNADIAQGRRHSFGLSRSADVAAVVQIDFNNKGIIYLLPWGVYYILRAMATSDGDIHEAIIKLGIEAALLRCVLLTILENIDAATFDLVIERASIPISGGELGDERADLLLQAALDEFVEESWALRRKRVHNNPPSESGES